MALQWAAPVALLVEVAVAVAAAAQGVPLVFHLELVVRGQLRTCRRLVVPRWCEKHTLMPPPLRLT